MNISQILLFLSKPERMLIFLLRLESELLCQTGLSIQEASHIQIAEAAQVAGLTLLETQDE